MSDKNLEDEQNTTHDAVIADGDLETVAGGIIDEGCTEPTFGGFGGGSGGGGGAGGSW